LTNSPLRILYIAYPLLPVSDASAGGAEQMLWTLEREMHRRGHQTTIATCAGSSVSGRLFVTGDAPRRADTFEDRNREHREAILNLLERETFDLIHDMSGSFFGSVDNLSVPLLATLHLPRSFYPDVNWNALAVNVKLNCVSAAQAHSFAEIPPLAGWVANGIALERFPLRTAKDDYLLWLGRICEEKAPHLAFKVAQRTGRRLILAGQVYPFSYHQEYFAREIDPHLGGPIQFIDSPSFEYKVELLANASALLVPSLVDETSSLVAMEAMACGTPVLAFRRGALPEVVSDGDTGYVVETLDDLVAAVSRLEAIDPETCRAHVEQHFSAIRMADDYAMLYQRVLGRSKGEAA
jgi:glycosyltransferase involved in cell wall biosynthesis